MVSVILPKWRLFLHHLGILCEYMYYIYVCVCLCARVFVCVCACAFVVRNNKHLTMIMHSMNIKTMVCSIVIAGTSPCSHLFQWQCTPAPTSDELFTAVTPLTRKMRLLILSQVGLPSIKRFYGCTVQLGCIVIATQMIGTCPSHSEVCGRSDGSVLPYCYT
jgi:hypothetical protein